MLIERDSNSQKVAMLVPVDPVSAINITNGALDIAVKLKSLFQDNDSARISKNLKIIIKQNQVIIRQLTEILDVLKNLGVIVQSAVRQELVGLIKDRISTALMFFYETYGVEVEGASPEVIEKCIEKYKEQFKEFSSVGHQLCLGESYGYAHFHTVGLAMIVGDWLAARIGEESEFRIKAFQTYTNYFEEALEEDKAGSIGQQLLVLHQQADRLGAILDLADHQIKSGFSQTFDIVKQDGNKTYYYKITETAVGDRINGYRVERKTQIVKSESEGGQNAGGVGGGTHFMPDPLDTWDKSVNGRVAYWNAVSTGLAMCRNDIRVLETAKSACEFYVDYAGNAV